MVGGFKNPCEGNKNLRYCNAGRGIGQTFAAGEEKRGPQRAPGLILDLYQSISIARTFGEGYGELLLNLFAEAGSGVIRAERVNQAVGRGVVDNAAFDAVDRSESTRLNSSH